jgi:hypothetical protein
LSSFGRVEGGADSVLDAILEVIGPKGNLMLPTFNYTRPIPEPYFDPAATPGHTGAIPEAGRKRAGAVRSLHPSHSVAVIGPDAVELTRDHLKVRALGIGSPIDRLAQRVCLARRHLPEDGLGILVIQAGDEHGGFAQVAMFLFHDLARISDPGAQNAHCRFGIVIHDLGQFVAQ